LCKLTPTPVNGAVISRQTVPAGRVAGFPTAGRAKKLVNRYTSKPSAPERPRYPDSAATGELWSQKAYMAAG